MNTVDRLNRGETLFMEIGEEGQLWWFEGPYETVDHDAARSAIAKTGAIEVGDNLFLMPGLSQCWRRRP